MKQSDSAAAEARQAAELQREERRLAEQAQAGDTASMDELFSRYKNLVRAGARGFFLLGAEPEDLVQEGMIGLFKAIRNYDGGKGSFSAFARVCIYRQFYTAIKLSNRGKHRALNDSVPLTEIEELELPLNFESPEEALLSREEHDSMARILAERLTKRERSVLSDYLSGLTYDEIAEAHGMSRKAVDNLLQKIKRKCRGAAEE